MSIKMHCLGAFPWISNQATLLGLETMDCRFAQLGGELFILNQHIKNQEQRDVNSALLEVAKLVNKACSIQGVVKDRGDELLDALQRIMEYQGSNTPAEETLISDVRYSLRTFVQKNPEYHSLLRLIADYRSTTCTSSPDTLPVEDMNFYNPDDEYPAQVNNALYTQLLLHSTCSCSTQHLDLTRLRMDRDNIKHDGSNIPYDMLFLADSTNCLANDRQVLWKEARISVSKSNSRGPSQKKRVAFTVQNASPLGTSPPGTLRKLKRGEFCKVIQSEKEKLVSLYVQDNVMKLTDAPHGTTWRNFLPQAGVPLAEWLEQIPRLSNRVKVTLAYTIARSAWQYYSSYWMMKPWTHNNVLMVKEKIIDGNSIKPHPYFVTKLDGAKGQILDYCLADDLLHIYPSILALGVVLVEIGAKQPFKPNNPRYVWDESTINEYYQWAWTTANGSNFGNTIGATYEAVVDSCLDAELYRDGPIDPSKLDQDLEMRRSILYEKVVLPLRQLHDAYKDDWDIQETSKQEESLIPSKACRTEIVPSPTPPNRHSFTIAIFCALTLEADAALELFDEVWDRKDEDYYYAAGDDHLYTFGRILHHNVILVHMADMGKKSASQAAAGIQCSYPDIKLALLVGICGAVPSREGKEDLILGDVVISEGIVQYDFGRLYPYTFLTRPDVEVISRPDHKLRRFLAKMKGMRRRERLESRISQYLGFLQSKLDFNWARYPGTDKDELFQSTYCHKHQDLESCRVCSAYKGEGDWVCEEARKLTCHQLGCQKDFLVPRKRLETAAASNCPPTPRVHFGFIGSGEAVVKSGQSRDKVAAQYDIVGFEMEASGIWDTLPCLVIKSTCDYADSHKNKYWQHYAAVTAAAGMKAVLEDFM